MNIYSQTLKIASKYSYHQAMSITLASGEVRKYTYHDLMEQVDRAAEKLLIAGVSCGDRVVLCAENGPQWEAAFLAILKVGATVALMDDALPEHQLKNCIQKSDAKCILVSPSVKAKMGLSTDYRVPILNVKQSLQAFSDSYSISSPFIEPTQDPMPEVALIFFEVNGSQQIKGIMFTHEALIRQVEMVASENSVARSERILSVISNSHIEGMISCVLMSLLTGGALHYVEALTIETLMRAFKVFKPTIFPTSGLLLKQMKDNLVKSLQGQRFDESFLARSENLREKVGLNLGSLLFKTVHEAFGGRIELIWCYGPIEEEVMRFYYAAGVDVLLHYGRTETNTPVLGNRDEEVTMDTYGKPYPKIEIQLRHVNEKNEGEMYIRSPYGMLGYFRGTEEEKAQYEEGWFKTGDYASLESSGNVKVKDSYPTWAQHANLIEDEGLPNKDQWAYYWFKAWQIVAKHLYEVKIENEGYLPKDSGYIVYSPFETSKGYLGLAASYDKAQFFKFGYLTQEGPNEHFKVADEAYGKMHILDQTLSTKERELCLKQLEKGWGIIIKAPKDAINAPLTEEVIALAQEANVSIIPAYLEGEEALFSGKEERPKLFNLRSFKRYALNLRYGKAILTNEEMPLIKRQIQEAFVKLMGNEVEEEIEEPIDERAQLALEMLGLVGKAHLVDVSPKIDNQLGASDEKSNKPMLSDESTLESRKENTKENTVETSETPTIEDDNGFIANYVPLSDLLATTDFGAQEDKEFEKVQFEEAESEKINANSAYEEEITFENVCLNQNSGDEM